jgi:hypothetical protein
MWYRHVFGCYPDDQVSQMTDLKTFQDSASLTDYEKLVSNVAGFLVEFPLQFLRSEDLKISIFNKEYYIPDSNFV